MFRLTRVCGIAVLSFGVGILFTFFLPVAVLIVIEALVIIVAGLLFIQC